MTKARKMKSGRQPKMRKPKSIALCPLCGGKHPIFGDYFLIASANRNRILLPNGPTHIGLQSEFYCDNEGACVVKMYTHDMHYIGYYLADEIPF